RGRPSRRVVVDRAVVLCGTRKRRNAEETHEKSEVVPSTPRVKLNGRGRIRTYHKSRPARSKTQGGTQKGTQRFAPALPRDLLVESETGLPRGAREPSDSSGRSHVRRVSNAESGVS